MTAMDGLYGRYHGRILRLARASTDNGAWKAKLREILAEDERRSFAFAVGEGGLYRVETLGRLKTEGWIGTPFIAEIDHQAANGRGQNMLLQSYLRAGRYRVTVAAKESAGRAGIVANGFSSVDDQILAEHFGIPTEPPHPKRMTQEKHVRSAGPTVIRGK